MKPKKLCEICKQYCFNKQGKKTKYCKRCAILMKEINSMGYQFRFKLKNTYPNLEFKISIKVTQKSNDNN